MKMFAFKPGGGGTNQHVDSLCLLLPGTDRYSLLDMNQEGQHYEGRLMSLFYMGECNDNAVYKRRSV